MAEVDAAIEAAEEDYFYYYYVTAIQQYIQ